MMYPVMLLDRQRCFLGSFLENCETLGVMVFFIPAECHDQLGTIERHNAVWREAFERVVDQHAVDTDEQIDIAITATCHGKNSIVKQYGRTPY